MSRRFLGTAVAIATAYVVAARLGFAVAFVAEQVTTVWAPTGIAMAALLLWGVRLWPAIWIGAFVANAGTDAPLWTAALIATGNTLEAVAVAVILKRLQFDPSLSRFADATRFIVAGAMAATTISATIGVMTLCGAGVQPWGRFATLWWAWWLGDALGALVVAPVLLTVVRNSPDWPARSWLGPAIMTAVGMVATEIVFGGRLDAVLGHGPLHYLLFPVVIIAAVRSGQPATALVVAMSSAVAIINTARGAGPFAAADPNEGLVLLQAYMGVLAGTGLLLAAAVTEQKATQRRLRLSEEELRQADHRKDEFLAVLAHELRNPLAPIRTGLELVRVSGDDPTKMQRLRAMMERQVSHMVRLIDDLLDVSRITSGKIHLRRETASLSGLIEAAIDANRDLIDGAGLTLTVKMPEEPVHLDVDPTRFVQVLSNLLHNASKFTYAPGQITVTATVESVAAGEQLFVSIADTGIGMTKELLPRVFDPFTQGDRSIARGQAGLGIGLALAQRIAGLHGGHIEARSAGLGRGSEFIVHLPLIQSGSAAGASDGPQEKPPLNRRVLVIDDNVDAADMMAWLVRSLGGEARTANDGPAGIAAASEFAPDVILLDIGMPEMDGYEVCRRIRGAQTSKPFIVAITGWGQERDKARAAEAGFDAHLTKPADIDVLEELLTNR
jgi:signal transduction histidine kinase